MQYQTLTQCKCKYNEWEDWLFPVIQATWEARTAGWLEKESFFHQTKAIRIKAPLAMGRSAEEASLHDATTEVGVPSPMQAAAFLDRPSSQ